MKKLKIRWTDDCSGKKDYDGDIVSVSTRFWPEHYQTNGLCSASCSILLHVGASRDSGEALQLIQKDFEGPSFAQVWAQVEAWALEQVNRVEAALKREFPDTTEEEA